MEVTTVSHVGIANRIKNILSAMSQYDKVNTLYETINYIFPSLELVEDPIKTYDEDWRLHIKNDEQIDPGIDLEKTNEIKRTSDAITEPNFEDFRNVTYL